ncbi:MAG: hypothetical protein KF862_26420 [Chitinophagaceae bacterium]|nr:hypothetical protein [Chitinophagaceae bacterium]
MKHTFSFVFLVLISISSNAQILDFKTTKNWTLYESQDFSVFTLPVDSVLKFRSIKLSDDTMKVFLKNATELKENPSWMGLHLVTTELKSGEIRKFEISMYGGFFYDDKEKKYYKVSDEVKDQWLQYFSKNSIRFD